MKHQPTLPKPPAAWLALRYIKPSQCMLETPFAHTVEIESAIGAFESADDPQLLALVERENACNPGCTRIALDHSSLLVTHMGIRIDNPAWLTARDNWFERYADILDRHLTDPRLAEVFTFSPGALQDPLASHKSSADGPFVFPRGAVWPTCDYCHTRLAFLGALDFRQFRQVAVPPGLLVLHVCQQCGVCADEGLWKLTWIKEGEPIEILGDRDRPFLVGCRWKATEYPTTLYDARKVVPDGPFYEENGIDMNFSCFADKIGGHVYRIQGGYQVNDSRGKPMEYIGQFIDSPDIEIGDCAVAYLYYSATNGETRMYPESS
jgi:hypothetical protein